MERYNKIFTNEQIKAIENNYSKMSLANVKSALKKIVASIKFDNFINIVNDETFLNEFDKMDLTTVCKANYLFIVIKLLKLCNVEIPEAYTKQVNIYSEARQKHNNNQRDKKVIDKTQYSLTDVYTFYKKIGLKEGDKNNNRFLVYFSILSNLPIRLTELCDMYVNKDNNVNNYIDLNKKQMIIRIHKSSRLKKNEVRIIPLNDETINDIKNYIQITKLDTLFDIGISGVKNLYRAGIEQFLQSTNSKEKVIGIHLYRTMFEHENLKKLNNKVTTDDLKQINKNCKIIPTWQHIETIL